MFLSKMSVIIARYHNRILVLWLIALLLGLPLASRFEEVLVYTETEMLPKDIESIKASKIILKEFPELSEPSVILVVVHDVRDEKLRNVLDEFKKKVLKEFPEVKDVYSIYDVYREVVKYYWKTMNETKTKIYRMALNLTPLLHSTLYSIYNNLSLLLTFDKEVSAALNIIYGVPYVYVKSWEEGLLKGIYHEDYKQLSEYAINRTRRFIKNLKDCELAERYLNLFTREWDRELNKKFALNMTKIVTQLEKNPDLLYDIAASIIRRIGLAFSFVNMPLMGFIVGLSFKTFNLKNFNNETLRREFVINIIKIRAGQELPKNIIGRIYKLKLLEEDIANLTIELTIEALRVRNVTVSENFLWRVWNLGPKPSPNSFRKMVKDILEEYPPPTFPEGIPEKYRKLLLSKNLNTTLVYIFLKGEHDEYAVKEDIRKMYKMISDLVAKYKIKGIEYYITGIAAFESDTKDITSNDVKRIDQVTVILVLVLLVILLTSLIAPIIPLASVSIAIVTSLAFLYVIGSYIIDIHHLSRNLMIPLVMGVGVDYSIYILYRFKEELEKGREPKEAIIHSIRFAGEGVTSAALTVMMGLGALISSSFILLRNLGISLVIPVLMALATATTFVPSILAIIGRKIYWPFKPRRSISVTSARAGYLRMVSSYAVKRPKTVILAFTIITLLSFIPLFSLKRTYDYLELMPETGSIKGFNILSSEFGSGLISKIYVVVKLEKPVVINETLTKDGYRVLKYIINRLNQALVHEDVSVISLISPEGELLEYGEVLKTNTSRFIGRDPCYSLVVLSIPYDPFSQEAMEIVKKVRSVLKDTKEVKVLVGGEAAANLDLSTTVDNEFICRILPVAIIGIMIVLYILTRSLCTSLALLAAVATSVLWSLALLTITFQIMLGREIYWIIPIMLVTTILGLGMDYGVFLVARVKEEYLRSHNKEEAILRGVETTGLVITACGIIMASALGSLLLSKMVTLQEIGFALSSAIIMDTFIVRPVFLPSVLTMTMISDKK